MAIDQSQLLQMLLQGGGGGPSISPTSGLQDPSLSGLALGPQGMGLGGGESLMGGGVFGGGFGGGGGGLGGLDISQLLAQLQAAPGVTGAGLGTGIGAGSLGGFGAGGQMGQEPPGSVPTPFQQGQAGLGAAGTTAQFLRLLKEGVGLGKTLTQLFPKGAESSQVSDINTVLAGLGISGTPFVPTASVVSGASGGSLPTPPFDASQTLPFQISPDILSGASGGGLLAGGVPLTGAELSARLGAQGLGDIPSIGAPVGALEGLGGLQGALGGLGILGNLGFGALNLAQGNTGAGLGGLLGTGSGLSLGAALAPETAGLSLLLGGLGGGVGGLFGSLFGGGGPSANWLSFGPRLRGTLTGEQTAAQTLMQALASARSMNDVQGAVQTFKQGVTAAGVGGFESRPVIPQNFGPSELPLGAAPSAFSIPDLPGATGTAHEGGLIFDPSRLSNDLRQAIAHAVDLLGPLQGSNLGPTPGTLLPWSTVGGRLPQLPRQAAPQAQAQPTIPPTAPSIPGVQGMNLPGSNDTDLLTTLQRMGLA